MRRSGKNTVPTNEPKTISFNDMKIDCENRRVYISDSEVNLTVKEFDLLELMVLNLTKYTAVRICSILYGAMIIPVT